MKLGPDPLHSHPLISPSRPVAEARKELISVYGQKEAQVGVKILQKLVSLHTVEDLLARTSRCDYTRGWL
jgi:hypothetical protein